MTLLIQIKIYEKLCVYVSCKLEPEQGPTKQRKCGENGEHEIACVTIGKVSSREEKENQGQTEMTVGKKMHAQGSSFSQSIRRYISKGVQLPIIKVARSAERAGRLSVIAELGLGIDRFLSPEVSTRKDR